MPRPKGSKNRIHTEREPVNTTFDAAFNNRTNEISSIDFHLTDSDLAELPPESNAENITNPSV